MSTAVDEVFAQLDAALDALAELDPETLDREEIGVALIAVHARRARMDAQVTRLTAAFEVRGDPQGALGTASWVSWKCRVKKAQARADVSNARALRHLPDVADAFAAGEVSAEHVRVLAA